METKTKKTIWIVGSIIAIVGIIFYFYKRGQKLIKELTNASNSGTGTTGTTTTPATPPYHGTDQSKWVTGYVIKAVAPIVNVYATPAASTAGIKKSYTSGQLIGIFDSMVGNYAKVTYIDSTLGLAYNATGYIFVTQTTSTSSNVTS